MGERSFKPGMPKKVEGTEGQAVLEKAITEEEKRLNQGERAREVFAGEYTSVTTKELYGESAQHFADIIKGRISKDEKYTFADFGSHNGGLQKNILGLLPEYDFHTIAVDVEKNLQGNDVADSRVAAALTELPFEDRSIDFAIARYILVWNNPENQQEMLREIARTVKDFAILQHAGADIEHSDEWRARLDDLFDGQEVPKCKRVGHYFSTRDEIEKWMKDNDIHFERVAERRIEAVSNVFIERMPLDEAEAEKTRRILAGKDYIIQTTWVIHASKEEE